MQNDTLKYESAMKKYHILGIKLQTFIVELQSRIYVFVYVKTISYIAVNVSQELSALRLVRAIRM